MIDKFKTDKVRNIFLILITLLACGCIKLHQKTKVVEKDGKRVNSLELLFKFEEATKGRGPLPFSTLPSNIILLIYNDLGELEYQERIFNQTESRVEVSEGEKRVVAIANWGELPLPPTESYSEVANTHITSIYAGSQEK
ncbi:MAG: hypothetical protein WC960_07990, partial [Bacteroidales bacterium]